MSAIFPFAYPAPTAFYLALYILTFVVHQFFMHYVLAGSLYVTWTALWPGRESIPRTHQPLALTLRDWLPFLLSAAITAGVAPLLFIQIVYQYQFYTANLLLWWRWMLVVPALIVAFYLLYLVKSDRLWQWGYPIRAGVTLLTSMSFVFVGFCWTVNHLLASSGLHWANVYVTGSLPFSADVIVLRMMIWIGGSFATMSAILGWQMYYRQALQESKEEGLVRTLACLTSGGVGVATVAGIIFFIQLDSETRQLILGLSFLPYLSAVILGVVLQGIGWTVQWRSDRFSVVGLSEATCGAVMTLFGVSVVREAARVHSIDLASLAERHFVASTVGGFGVFLVASIFVLAVMAWCVQLVRTGGIKQA